MGKLSFAGTSFVAAVPAGLLATLIVMEGFMKRAGDMGGLMLGLVGATLGVCAFVVLIPFGILIFGGPKQKKLVVNKPAKGKADDNDISAAASADMSEADVDVLSTSGEAAIMDSDDIVAVEDDDDATTAFTAPIDEDEMSLSDEAEVLDDDLESAFEIESISDEVILEEEDEDTPKKKKKR